MKKRTANILKRIGWAAIAVAVLFVILSLTSNAALMVSASRAFDRANAALKADGRPTKMEEIIPPAIPDADNAALEYCAAALQLKAEPAGEENLLLQLSDLATHLLNKKSDTEGVEQFRRLSNRTTVSEALATIEKGSRKPHCRHDIDYFGSWDLDLSHAVDLANLSRIVSATARLQTIDGDHSAATESALTALRLANALEDEPLLISQLHRSVSLINVLSAIHKLDFPAGISRRQFEEMEELLKFFEDPSPFVNAMDGERLLMGERISTIPLRETRQAAEFFFAGLDGTVDNRMVYFLALGNLFPPLRMRDHVAFITAMHALTQNLLEPYSQEDEMLVDQLFRETPRYCILARVSSVGSMKWHLFSNVANARVSRAGLAVLQHRQEHGAWPANLEVLNRNDLTDPFDGKPLRYHPSPTGFTVYSVGPDLVDDKGAEYKAGKGDKSWQYSD